MRVYLDVCCLNRPLDDLSVGRNRLEAEAVLQIVRHVQSGKWELVGSEAVDAELSLTPSSERRSHTAALSQLRSVSSRRGRVNARGPWHWLGLGCVTWTRCTSPAPRVVDATFC